MSTAALKYTALILMLIDHIGEFFPQVVPIWFRWLGRLSAPLFFFCLAHGLDKTHDRKKYVQRLWLSSAVMGAGNFLLIQCFPNSAVNLTNNIFSTMTMVAMSVWIIESMNAEQERNDHLKHPQMAIVFFLLAQFGLNFLCNILANYELSWAKLLNAFLPTATFCEGGLNTVVLGVILYFCKSDRKKLCIGYGTYCGLQFFLTAFNAVLYKNIGFMLWYSYQWMMIASLPLMLLYNGKKGKSNKLVFYLFYPLHIWALFILSNLLIG